MSDVTVHIDETLTERSIQALSDEIEHYSAVEHVDYSLKHPHLMVVKYDPTRMDSSAILAAISDQGLHAELIGF